MHKLASRGLNVDSTCPRCGEGCETTTLLLLQCKEAKVVWMLSPLRLEMEDWEMGFQAWCEHYAKKCSVERAWELAMMAIWQIWRSRNN